MLSPGLHRALERRLELLTHRRHHRDEGVARDAAVAIALQVIDRTQQIWRVALATLWPEARGEVVDAAPRARAALTRVADMPGAAGTLQALPTAGGSPRLARDLMTSSPVCVTTRTRLRDAIEVMYGNDIQ